MLPRCLYLLSPLAVVWVAACSGPMPSSGGKAGPADAGSTPNHGAAAAPSASCPARISLEQACALALSHNPELRSIPLDRRIADAGLLTAGRFPNPSLQLEVEDFAGSGEYSGTRSAIYTASIVQTVETGGKRAARSTLAGALGETTEADYRVRRREVFVDTCHRYVEALAAKEMLALAEREVALARDSRESVKLQVDAGRANESELHQAELVVTRAELASRQARRNSDQALTALAAQWGCRGERPSSVAGLLPPPKPSLPSRSHVEGSLSKHPEIAAAGSRAKGREAGLQLARSARNPDVELMAGARHDNAADDQAFVVGASVPLPLFNRQRGPIREAEAGLEKAELAVESTRINLAKRFDAAWTELANSHDEAITVEKSLLPGAREIFSKTRESYELGNASYLELIEARRQLDAVNHRWVEARRDFQKAAASLQGLTGSPL